MTCLIGQPLRIGAAAAAGALLLIAGCGSSEPKPIPPFSEVDQYTSGFFIQLEKTDLVRTQGAERTYNLGVNACGFMDKGKPAADELRDLVVESKLGDDAGSLLASAVVNLCPQHTDAVKAIAG